MVEFFQNIWKAISDNWAATGATISVTTVLGVIFVIAKQVLSNKLIKANTSALTKVTESSTALIETESKMQILAEATLKLHEQVDANTKALSELKDFYNGINCKLDAVIDAMTLAYSTVSDDDIRTNITAILSNCKFAEADKVVKLEEQLAALKQQLKEMTEAMSKKVEETVATATETVNSVARY